MEKEIKSRLPLKNPYKIKAIINDLYETNKRNKQNQIKEKERHITEIVKEQDDENESGNASMLKVQVTKSEVDKKFEVKKKIYREYFNYLTQKLDIKVCEFSEREENDDEFKKRLEEKEFSEEKSKSELPSHNKLKRRSSLMAAKKDVNEEKEEHLKIRESIFTNLDMSEKCNKYSKWVGSQIQLIKDLNILDINVLYLVILNNLVWKEYFSENLSSRKRNSNYFIIRKVLDKVISHGKVEKSRN